MSISRDTYTSANGLRFPTSYAGQYLDCHGAWDCDLNQQIDTRNATTPQACQDLCSVAHPRCYGVSFNTITNACYIKGKPLQSLTSSTSYVSYAADTSQIIGKAQPCTNGVAGNCNVVCDKQYSTVGLYKPANIPNLHADTFQQCSDYCTKANPPCKSFTWAPEMEYGYENCYLRNISTSTMSGQDWPERLQNCDIISPLPAQSMPPTTQMSGAPCSSSTVISASSSQNAFTSTSKTLPSSSVSTSSISANASASSTGARATYSSAASPTVLDMSTLIGVLALGISLI